MLKNQPLVAFVATTQPEAARGFYVDVLGLELISDDQFALVINAGGTALRVTRVEDLQPAPFTVLGWLVDEVESAAADLAARGVQFERYGEWMEQDAHGIWTALGGARIAWFKDPAGNILSVIEG